MCMTEDGDALLERARILQDVRAGRVSAYLTLPVRDEAEVAMGMLMAAIEDANTGHAGNFGIGLTEAERNRRAANLLVNILCAKQRYDAARLTKGDRTLPVIGLNVQTDELDDGLGGEIG